MGYEDLQSKKDPGSFPDWFSASQNKFVPVKPSQNLVDCPTNSPNPHHNTAPNPNEVLRLILKSNKPRGTPKGPRTLI